MVSINKFPLRRKLIFDTTLSMANIATDQSSFPIFIEVSAQAGWDEQSLSIFFDTWNSFGGRIQFYDMDGETPLSYQTEQYDVATRIARYWVKVPTIAGNSRLSFIYLGFGTDPNGTPQPNVVDVWSNGYAMVNHMNFINQACSKTNIPMTKHGSVTSVSGYIRSANSFPGADTDWLDLPDTNNAFDCPREVTITNWLRLSANNNALKIIVTKEDGVQDTNYRWRVSNDNKLRFSWTNPATAFQSFSGNTVLNVAGGWYHSGVTSYQNTNGATGKERVSGQMYLNGAADGPAFNGADDKIFQLSDRTVRIGNSGVAGQNFYGLLDEIRIANVTRTDDWMKLEYISTFFANGFSGGNLVILGPVETAGIIRKYW